MRSAAEPSTAALGRSSDLLDQVDYRLAQTPEEKEEIYNLRYRAYLREGAVQPSAEQRVTDQYDDLPNSWTFGVYLFGELYSSVRISVLTSEWRQSCSAEAFGEILNPRLDRGQVIIDPARFVADPDKAKRFPELPYVTLRLAYMACGGGILLSSGLSFLNPWPMGAVFFIGEVAGGMILLVQKKHEE